MDILTNNIGSFCTIILINKSRFVRSRQPTNVPLTNILRYKFFSHRGQDLIVTRNMVDLCHSFS